MKYIYILQILLFCFFQGKSKAALIVNLGGEELPLGNFSINDANLQANSASFGLNNGTDFANANALTSGAINNASGTIATLIADSRGGIRNAGIVNSPAHNSDDAIVNSNLFDNGGRSIGFDITGLDNLDAGSLVTLTVYGLGDNLGQDSSISAEFNGVTQIGNTVFNTSGQRNDDTGTVFFQQFMFTADGLADELSFTVSAGPGVNFDGNGGSESQGRSHLSGFSLSVVPVPEPSGGILLATMIALVSIFGRRRRPLPQQSESF